MGKLHTLKRAIQRHPEKYIVEFSGLKKTKYAVSGAFFSNGKWIPSQKHWGYRSYQRFIAKVLKELGYDVQISL